MLISQCGLFSRSAPDGLQLPPVQLVHSASLNTPRTTTLGNRLLALIVSELVVSRPVHANVTVASRSSSSACSIEIEQLLCRNTRVIDVGGAGDLSEEVAGGRASNSATGGAREKLEVGGAHLAVAGHEIFKALIQFLH